MQYRTRTKNMS